MADVRKIQFPIKGLNRNAGYDVVVPGTTQLMLNVRPHDSLKGRGRGGTRPGLKKWLSEQVDTGVVQSIVKGALAKAVTETENVTYQGFGWTDGNGFNFQILTNEGSIEVSFTIPIPGAVMVGGDENGFFLVNEDRTELYRFQLVGGSDPIQLWTHTLPAPE